MKSTAKHFQDSVSTRKSPHPRSQNPIPTSIKAYLNNVEDSHLPRRLATDSRLPENTICSSRTFGGFPLRYNGTSMLHSGPDSLAALTTEWDTQSSSSVPTISGEKYLGKPRILEYDMQGALRIPPLRDRTRLECPFSFLYCQLTFNFFDEWLEHSLTHFGSSTPPTANRCCFCDQDFTAPTGEESWNNRMKHVSIHHQIGHRLAHARPDFMLYKYLWNKHIISNSTLRELMGPESTRNPRQRSPSPSPPARHSKSHAYVITNNNREARRRDRRGG